jgi:hypothetical protein
MGGTGISVGADSIVENVRALGNAGIGISVGLNSAVRSNVSSSNGVHGMVIAATWQASIINRYLCRLPQ